MNSVFLFGALRVVIRQSDGCILAVLSAIDGRNASSVFAQHYIDVAVTLAHLAWASTADE